MGEIELKPTPNGPSTASLPAAVLFDMDGVLVDSNPFHVQKWIDLLRQRKVAFVPDEVPSHVLGKFNDDAFRYYFGSSLTPEEMRALGEDLEARFRSAFRPYAKPLPGLEALIRGLRNAGVPMAVCSSAIRTNVEFVVDVLGFRPFFQCLISGDDVRAHKPDPEIYLAAAARLQADPGTCVGFEDSFVGIQAVKNAGMKCVAIASTFSPADLRSKTRADCIVSDFTGLSPGSLGELAGRTGTAPRGGEFTSP